MSLMIHIFIHFHIIGRIVEKYLFIFQKSLVYFWLKAGYLLNIQTQRTSLNQFEVSRTSVLFYERLQDNLFWVSPKKPKEIRTWIYQGEGPKQVRFLGEKQRWKIKNTQIFREKAQNKFERPYSYAPTTSFPVACRIKYLVNGKEKNLSKQ